MKGEIECMVESTNFPFALQITMSKQVDDFGSCWHIRKLIPYEEMYYLDTPLRNRFVIMIIDGMLDEMENKCK